MTSSCKLLSGGARGALEDLVPSLVTVAPSRSQAGGLHIKPSRLTKYPLDVYRCSYVGCRHQVWGLVPQEIVAEGNEKGWKRVIKSSKNYFYTRNLNKCSLYKLKNPKMLI